MLLAHTGVAGPPDEGAEQGEGAPLPPMRLDELARGRGARTSRCADLLTPPRAIRALPPPP